MHQALHVRAQHQRSVMDLDKWCRCHTIFERFCWVLAFLSTITNLKHELKQMKTTGSTYLEHCKVLLLVVLEVVAKNW